MSEGTWIVYSPGFGAGWSTWNEPILATDPEIVGAVRVGDREAANARALVVCPGAYLGADKLELQFIPSGESYRIGEYDGFESIEYADSVGWGVG